MRRSRKPIVIASRGSDLARVQAQRVGAALAKLHPKLTVEFLWIESHGDRLADRALNDAGGKGLFTRAVDQKILDGAADIAVHSLKDLPAKDTPGLALAAIPKRNDTRDVLIAPNGATSIAELPNDAVFGTSSPRRRAQLLRLRPNLNVKLLRGNVPTRLQRVHDGHDGITFTLMAAAGLKRLGLADHLKHPIPTDDILPAACQGAIALVIRSDDHVALTRCLPLNNAVSAAEVHAERQLLAGINADCNLPVAVLAEQSNPGQFRFRAQVYDAYGTACLSLDEQANTKSLRRVVAKAITTLLDQGVDRLLATQPTRPTPA
ncbi:MAG: hydroxymethylbilane synthase [Phycisphaeraceae bacterium]